MDHHIKVFWETGNGSQLIKWSGAEINMAHYRYLGAEYDVLGDEATKEMLTGSDFKAAYAYVQKQSQTTVLGSDALSENVKKCF